MLVALPVLYVASFGPACWWIVGECSLRTGFANAIAARKAASSPPFRTVYWPIGWLAQNGPDALTNAITWYATRRCDSVILPCDRRGDNCVMLGDSGFF